MDIIQEKIKKYQRYIDNLLLHIKTNNPPQHEKGEIQHRLNDFNEIIIDLKEIQSHYNATYVGDIIVKHLKQKK